MSLSEKIAQDMKQAMMAKDETRLSTIRFLRSAVQYARLEKPSAGSAPGDAEILQVIQKQIKQHRESIQQFTAARRNELAAKEESELRILESYLPKQVSDDELKKIAQEAVRTQEAAGKKDFGRMMKYLNEKLAGQADNKRLSEILGGLLK